MSAAKEQLATAPSRESQVDLKQRMFERVRGDIARRRHRVRNPSIPNNPFDALYDPASGLPQEFVYHPVEVPNPQHPGHQSQVAVLNDYLWCGFQFLTDDMVTKDGRNGTAMLPDFVVLDHRVVVAGCYVLYASKDWYERSRHENVEKRNAILTQAKTAREEELEKVGGNRSVQRVTHQEERDVTNEMLDREEGLQDDDE